MQVLDWTTTSPDGSYSPEEALRLLLGYRDAMSARAVDREPGNADLPPLTRQDHANALEVVGALLREIGNDRGRAVEAALAAGLSWRAIGSRLRVDEQLVREEFRSKLDTELESSWKAQGGGSPDLLWPDEMPRPSEAARRALGYDDDRDSGDGDRITPAFDNVIDWVEGYFLPVVRRRVELGPGDLLVWDEQWWMYPEVVARFMALHYAWEAARASDHAAAMSSWWIQHLDPHLRVILDPHTGPMARRSRAGSEPGVPRLPNSPVPNEVRDAILRGPDS